MKVFIAGGSGCIGNAVAQAFLNQGDHVICLCNTPASANNLKNQGLVSIVGDMKRPVPWIHEAKDADVLIHATHIRPGMRLSSGWLKKSTTARDIALKALVKAGKTGKKCKALIYTSGMIAHGDHGDTFIDENTKPRKTALGAYHLGGEKIIMDAAAQGLTALSIRPGMVYSPKGTFAKFFLAVAEKGKYQFPGTGRNYLPFVHISDLANAYLLAAKSPPAGHVINVVDDKPIPVIEMAEHLLNEFNGGKVSAVPTWVVSVFAGKALSEILVGSFRVQNKKAKQLLKWQPQFKTFEDGISDVVNSYQRLKIT